MNCETKLKIRDILLAGSVVIMRNYTKTVLLINSCHLAIERYQNMEEEIHLSTTANIPEPLRLQPEYELTLEKEDLVEKYQNEVQKQLYVQYVTNSVSVVDGIFEDIYEVLLQEFEEGITEQQITNKLRSAWAQNNLINYFLEKTQIQDSEQTHLRIKEAFDRYLEYRIIRHALVHNKGILSDKHIRQLDELYDNADDISKERSMRNSPFYANKEVSLNINILLGIRKYLYSNVSYFLTAIDEINCE